MAAVEPLKAQVLRFYDDLPTWGKAILAGGATLALYIPYRYYTTRPRKSPIKEDFEKDVVYLYQFPRVKNIPSMSPYCLKLETWLRMADIRYENVDCGWHTRSLEGTVPFIEYNGREYPDSTLAIRDMTAIHSKETMENHLTEEQRCVGRAFEKLAECSLMQTVSQITVSEHADEMFAQAPSNAFGLFTPLIGCIMKKSLVCDALKRLKIVGIGKHSRDEIVNIATDDLRAVSRYLGTKHYILGFKPTRVDATVFAVLAQIVYAPYSLPQKELILDELTNLKDYCERMKQRFWPDWEEVTTQFTLNTIRKKKY